MDITTDRPSADVAVIALDGELGLRAALGEEERVAARAAHVEAERRGLGDDAGGDRAAGRAGEQHRRGVLRRLLQSGSRHAV